MLNRLIVVLLVGMFTSNLCLGQDAAALYRSQIPPKNDLPGGDVPGVAFDLVLDQSEVMFPDIVYGFVRIRNTSGMPSYVPTVRANGIFLEIQCNNSVVLNNVQAAGAPQPRVTPADFYNVYPFVLRYNSPEFIENLNLDYPTRVQASQTIRPVAVPSPPGEIGSTLPSWDRSKGYLTAKATTSIKIDRNQWIFKDPTDRLINFAVAPSHWKTRNNLFVLFTEMYKNHPNLPQSYPFYRDDSFTILSVPILSVFPSLVETIQDKIRCDTASWRYLELMRLARMAKTGNVSPEKTKALLDRAMQILCCGGPSEVFMMSGVGSSIWENVRDQGYPLPAAEVLMLEVLGEKVDARKYWADQLTSFFPGIPFGSLQHDPSYGDDGNYLDFGRIDMDLLRSHLDKHQARMKDTEDAPCDCN